MILATHLTPRRLHGPRLRIRLRLVRLLGLRLGMLGKYVRRRWIWGHRLTTRVGANRVGNVVRNLRVQSRRRSAWMWGNSSHARTQHLGRESSPLLGDLLGRSGLHRWR